MDTRLRLLTAHFGSKQKNIAYCNLHNVNDRQKMEFNIH